MATLLKLNLRPNGETFDDSGSSKSGTRIYIAKFDGPVNDINDFEAIPGLPAKYDPWDVSDHPDTFCNKRAAAYHEGQRSILLITVAYSSTDDSGRPFGSLLNEQYTRNGGFHTGVRTYKIDSSYADSDKAIDAPVIPVINQVWSNTRKGVLVYTHDATRQKDGSYIVDVSYTTTTPEFPEKPENPLDEPVDYKYSSTTEEREIEVDQVTGDRIEYTNGRPVLPLRKNQQHIGVFTVTRNEAFFSNATAQKYRGKTNSRIMNIDGQPYGIDEILCKSINADPFYDQEDTRYFKVVYTFWYKEETWKDKIVNADFKDVNGNKFPKKGGFEDIPIALDINGEFIPGDVAPNDRVFVEPNIYERADLEVLGL